MYPSNVLILTLNQGKLFNYKTLSHFLKVMIENVILRFLSNENCEEKKFFLCMTKSLETHHEVLCPKSFIRYKTECYYHSWEKGDYNKSEVLCAEKGSRIIPIKDRATYQFIRSWSIKQNHGDFYLGKF